MCQHFSKQSFNRQNNGPGDISPFGLYTAYQKDWSGRTLRIAPFVRFKTPTGKNDSSDNVGRQLSSIQPGSGF